MSDETTPAPDDATAGDITADDATADDITADDATTADTATERAPDAGAGARAERAAELRAQVEQGETIPVSEFRKRSRRSFLTGAAGILGAGVLWNYVQNQSQPVDRIPGILRGALEFGEAVWSDHEGRLAPEYDIADASPIQVNGRVGIRDEIEPLLDGYTVEVIGPDGELLDQVTIPEFAAMPRRDMVTEHKCIEGWSNITFWNGVPFADFHQPYADRIDNATYVSLETPEPASDDDRAYYVGWDLEAILHPQTLLALEQNGEPLDRLRGAPIRLASPNKYGIKCIKRIKTIRYLRERPRDYWADRGYDWYAGL